MAGLIDELVILLREQSEDFSDLAALASEKSEAIVKNNIEHLQKITNIEHSLVGKNQKNERRLVQMMNDVATVLNVNTDSLTISHLVELLKDQPGHGALDEVGTALRQAADELRKRNEQNRKLIENSLEYIDFSMNLMRSSQTPPSYYTHEGEEIPGTVSTFFDTKQ